MKKRSSLFGPNIRVLTSMLLFAVLLTLFFVGNGIWAYTTPVVTGTVVSLSAEAAGTEVLAVEINGEVCTFERTVKYSPYSVEVKVRNPFVSAIVVEVTQEVYEQLKVGDQVKFWR